MKKKKKQTTSVAIATPFKRYIYETSKYPLLSKEEEYKLTLKYKHTHNPEIAKKLILSNLRLVVKIAMEYYNKICYNIFDLIQEGNIGLIFAVRKYDPSKGIRLASYAQFWIRAYILKYILDNYGIMRIATTKKDKKIFYDLQKAKKELAELGYETSPKILAEYIKVKEKDVIDMQRRLSATRNISLDTPINKKGRPLQDFIKYRDYNLEEKVADDDMKEYINKKMNKFYNKLNSKEAIIWKDRLIAENPQTLKELGRELKISQERVRQLQNNIIKKLKKFKEEEMKGFEIEDLTSRY